MWTSWPVSVNSIARLSAESRLSSTIRMRRGAVAAGLRPDGSRGRGGSGAERSRQTHHELAALTDTRAAGFYCAAVHLHQHF